MKLSAKPVSSPGRTEKFPPPLMRFLRSNGGSRSRGRSRSSPMFVRKKNAAIETQEPSSPKVTCMGQVRVRRSSKQTAAGSGGERRRRRCRWIRAALFCPRFHFPRKIRPRIRNAWSKWVLFFQVRPRGKSEIRRDLSRVEQGFRGKTEGNQVSEAAGDDNGDEEEEEEAPGKAFECPVSSPPKNALLLTRCRSAPYRSSSLACRFWSSPLRNEEKEEAEERREAENGDEQAEIEKPPSKETTASDEKAVQEPGAESESGFSGELEGHSGGISKSPDDAKLKAEEENGLGDSARPLILPRCKSEPARTAEKKLDPELKFWKNRRSGIPD